MGEMADRFWRGIRPYTESRPMTAQEQARYQEEKRQKANRPVEPGFLAHAFDKIEYTYQQIQVKAGWIPQTATDFSKELKKIGKILSIAGAAGHVAGVDATTLAKIDEAKIAFAKISEPVAKGVGVSSDISAMIKLRKCAQVLEKWQNNPQSVGNLVAAEAFDTAFGALALFVGKLPPPLNAYASVFEEISKNSFFFRFAKLYSGRPEAIEKILHDQGIEGF